MENSIPYSGRVLMAEAFTATEGKLCSNANVCVLIIPL